MSGISQLANTAGNSLAGGLGGSLGSQLGYALGNLTGYNERLRKDQINQQQKLTDMQQRSNSQLMGESYEHQLDMWNKTNYPAQVEQLKKAGLNPALMYGHAGAGGTTGGGNASVGAGDAANTAATQNANTQQTMGGLAMMKASSEIDLNKAQAEKLRADAQTSNELRPWTTEETKQRGKSTWYDNQRKAWENEGGSNATSTKNAKYGEGGISATGLYNLQKVAELTETNAKAGNQDAQALLTNKKAMGYFTELLNETKRADAAATQAAAIKLAAEFNYGEYTNWKYWLNVAKDVAGIIPKY